MEQHSLQVLEYPKIIAELAGFAASELGRDKCLDLKPITDYAQIQNSLNLTSDAVAVILQKGIPPLQGLHNVSGFINRSRSGAAMNCAELLKVAAFLRAISRLKSFVDAEAMHKGNKFYELMSGLEPNENLSKRIAKAILSEDEVADAASPELYNIRTQLKRAQEKVRNILESLMKNNSKALQEQLITMRGSRYVLPVKDSHRQYFPGIVHDSSGSGQTLFIEPMAVVEANNRIRELESDEREEINRILAVLSSEVVSVADSFIYNQNILRELDFIAAKARYALSYKGQPAQINNQGFIKLLQARHPLLPKTTAVPISLELGGEIRTLLITGPNTGGKTVALKTCGLLVLMTQAGLHIPASEQSKVAIFDEVLVDIGDEQSIEQSLSTFSSHMSQLVEMTNKASQRTLIISDEMGSGTDPLEGAALARSILETWQKQGALTMASTHYRELKLYALTTPGVLNACCELDAQTLKPTYRILMGAAGVSHAFAISERLGLNPEIIANAKALVKDEDRKLENLMQSLTRDKQALHEVLEQARQDAAAQAKAQAEATKLASELKTKKQDIIAKAREEARTKYKNSLEEADALIDELRSLIQRVESDAEIKTVLSKRQHLGEAKRQVENEIGAATLANLKATEVIKDLKVGASYFAPSLGIAVKLESLPDNKGNCLVSSGSLRLSVTASSLGDIRLQPKANNNSLAAKSEFYRQKQINKQKQPNGRHFEAEPSQSPTKVSQGVPIELMLLGENSFDAVAALDKYIDDAMMVGLHEIRIVHGKGTGMLRKAVQNFLRQDRRIKSYRLAGFGEGDAGVTIAILK